MSYTVKALVNNVGNALAQLSGQDKKAEIVEFFAAMLPDYEDEMSEALEQTGLIVTSSD